MRALRTAADETFPMNALVCLTEEVCRPFSPTGAVRARAPLHALAWRVCVMPWGSAGRASCGPLSPSDSGVIAPLQSMRCHSQWPTASFAGGELSADGRLPGHTF